MKRTLVFGTFDGVHEGHRSLFAQAREYGDELVAAVARDRVVERLKGTLPRSREEERRALVEQEPLVDRAVLGDEELSVYGVLENVRPDVICLGYDQEELAEDLERWFKDTGVRIPVRRLRAYKPGAYHNSLA